MSEEVKKRFSAFEAFAQTQLTYQEAEEKVKAEAGTPKVERFRIGEDGEYSIRVLPLAPNFDAEGNVLPMDRKGYEYTIHQLFISIKAPSKKGGKPKKITIPIIRTTDKEVGYSVDLIDTYVKIAKEKYADDKELVSKLDESAYSGGLRWSYQHAMMVLNLENTTTRAKGPLLFQCSHGQYRDIEAAKMRLWRENIADGEPDVCPITSFKDAYPVKIIRATAGKTEYTVEIGRKKVDIEESEAEKLLDMPRIPELIYRYTRYQMEATVEFLKQFDEVHGTDVCSQPDFIEAKDKLSGELPADDTSHFDLSGASAKSDGDAKITIDTLWSEYDNIVDQDLNEKSDEYQDLRERIRQFIEDNDLDVRISRTKNNQQLLEEIEEALESVAKTAPKQEEEKPAAKPRPETRPARKPEPEPEPEPEEDEDDDDDSPEPEPEQKAPERPKRRSRPGATDTDENPQPEPEPEADEAPRRRLHNRRLR